MLEAGLIDLYDNVERRLGDKAWILPWAVAVGGFFVHKALLHKSTGRSLLSAAMTGVAAAGLVGKGHNLKTEIG